MSAISSLRHLWALRSFEAAARLLSFQKAAQELNLTPSAVSHQIKRLELEIGQPLFVREPRSIRLTAAGAKLQEHVTRGFSELSRGLGAIADTGTAQFRLSVAPAFAARYLTAQVAAFERANPKLRLKLDVSQPLVNLNDGTFDAVVRLSYGGGPGIHAENLAHVTSAVVCSPAVASRISKVEDVQALTRITVNQLDGEWDAWYRSMGRPHVQPKRELRFAPMLDSIQAAIDGVGLVIAPLLIVEKHLQASRLVLPFNHTFRSKVSYLFLCRKGEETSNRVKRVRTWIKRAMKE